MNILWKYLRIIMYLFFITACLFFFPSCETKVDYTNNIEVNVTGISEPYYKELVLQLNRSIPELMDIASIPGLSFVLYDTSGIIWKGDFGVENVISKKPVNEGTIFFAASLSKVVFAYNVLRLVDINKIDLDKPLINYIPIEYFEEEYKKIDDKRFNNITARMVLNHSSGIPDMGSFNKSVKIDFLPGSRFRYSGEAYYLLQKAVEYIESKTINEVIKTYVFDPLEMNNSSFILNKKFGNSIATGHDKQKKPGIFNVFLIFNINKAHMGRSLLTTSTDYAKFLVALMRGQGLNMETSEKMLSPQINAGNMNNGTVFWGLGLGIEDVKNYESLYWHNGNAMVFKNYFAFRKNDIGFLYFSNSVNGLSICEKLSKIVFDQPHPSFSWIGEKQIQ